MRVLSHPLQALKSIAIFAMALSCTGCFWVPAETGVRMQADIRDLQNNMRTANKHLEQQAAHLEEQSAQLANQMNEAADKVAEVAEALQNLNRAARMTDADLGVQIERLIKEVQELRGSVELSDYRVGKIEGQFEGDQSIVTRIENLEKEQNALPIPKKKVASKAPAKSKTAKATNKTSAKPKATTAAKPTPKAPPKGKKELLAYGESLVKSGKIQDARGVFRDLVRRYPKTKGITDKAFFTLGETYFQNKKYRNALQEYIKVVDRFPKGPMADDAYYRIGSCSMEIGNLEDANIFFNEIVENHKKSPLLKAARGKLKEVQKRLNAEKKKKKTVGKKG